MKNSGRFLKSVTLRKCFNWQNITNTIVNYDGASVRGCKSDYDTGEEQVKVHSFLPDPVEKQEWKNALINTLLKEPKERHDLLVSNTYLPIIKLTVKKNPEFLQTPGPFFLYPVAGSQAKSYLHHKMYKIYNVSWSLVTQKRQEQLEKMLSWESLIEFCHKLNVTVININDSVMLTEIAEIQPQMLFYRKLLNITPYLVLKGIPKPLFNECIFA